MNVKKQRNLKKNGKKTKKTQFWKDKHDEKSIKDIIVRIEAGEISKREAEKISGIPRT